MSCPYQHRVFSPVMLSRKRQALLKLPWVTRAFPRWSKGASKSNVFVAWLIPLLQFIPSWCGLCTILLSSQKFRDLRHSERNNCIVTTIVWLCQGSADIIKFQRIQQGSRKQCFSWFHVVWCNWRLLFLSVTSMLSVTRKNICKPRQLKKIPVS